MYFGVVHQHQATMYSQMWLVIEAFRQKYRLVGMAGQILEKKEKKIASSEMT